LQIRLQDIWDRTALGLGTGLGIGYIPVMPGTFGTLLGIPLAWAIGSTKWPTSIQISVEVGILLIGIPICGRAARLFGRTDPGSVVYDELAAFPLVFLSVPMTFTTAILGFIWFRIFDIVKPWPVRMLERLPGGLGIMADDVAAALFAALALWLTLKAYAAV